MDLLYDLLVTCAFAVTIAMVWWLHKPVPLGVAAIGAAFGFLSYRGVQYFTGGIAFGVLIASLFSLSVRRMRRSARTADRTPDLP